MELSRPGSGPLLLELDLSERPAEPDGNDPLERFRQRGRRLLRPTLRALHEAGDDPRVVGLIAKIGPGPDWSTVTELRDAVHAFARSGKPSLAWAESLEGGGATAALVLAAAFEKFWLQPGGGIGPLGVGVQTTFAREGLARLGIEAQVEQRREYKNAPDQLLRDSYSEAHREALERVTASVFDDAVAALAADRGLDPDRVRRLADAGPLTAAQALEAGLCDRLGYRDQAHAELRGQLPDDTRLLYADRWVPRRRVRLPLPRRHVALVEVRGGIVQGRSRRGPGGRQVGSDSVAAQLRAAGQDDRAAAVLLRVDSPGGSAVASEVIWREVVRLRESGRPVVVSMGALAASGGYYVACPADLIVAGPATLTGSIGVFSGKVVITDLLTRLGLHTEEISQGEQVLMNSARRRFTPAERDRLIEAVDAIYADFVAKVAAGRGRSVEEIEPLARGRVWTGRDALERGLVDRLGGLREAGKLVRERAGLAPDAPIRPALRVPPLARLGRPRNSEDPRALAAAAAPVGALTLLDRLSGADDLGRLVGLPAGHELRVPPLRLR